MKELYDLRIRIVNLCDLADSLDAMGINADKVDSEINKLRIVEKKLSFFLKSARRTV